MKTLFLLLILCIIGVADSKRSKNEVKEFPFDTDPNDSNYLIKHYFNSAFGALDRTDKRKIYKLLPFLSRVDLKSTNLLLSAYIEAVLNNTSTLNLKDLPNIRKQPEGSKIDDKIIRDLLNNILKESKTIKYEDVIKIHPQYALPTRIKLKNKFINDYIDFLNYIVEETDFERIELDKNYKPNLNAELNDIHNAAQHTTQQPSLLNLNPFLIPSPVIPEVKVPEVEVQKNQEVDLSAFNVNAPVTPAVDFPVTPTVDSPDEKVEYRSDKVAEPEDNDTITVIEAPDVKNNPANFDKLDKMKLPAATFNDKPVEELNLRQYLIDEVVTPRIDFDNFLKLEIPKKERVQTNANRPVSITNLKPTASSDLKSKTDQANANKPTIFSGIDSTTPAQAALNKPTTFSNVESTTAQGDVNKPTTSSDLESTTAEADVNTSTTFSDVESTTAQADLNKPTTSSGIESTTAQVNVNKPTTFSDVDSTTAQADVNKPTTFSNGELTTARADFNRPTISSDVESTTAQADVNKPTTTSDREFTAQVTANPSAGQEDKSTSMIDLESTTQSANIKPTVTTTYLETTTLETTTKLPTALEHTTSSVKESTIHIKTTDSAPDVNIKTVTQRTTTTSEIASTTEATETTTTKAFTSNAIELSTQAENTDSTSSTLHVLSTLEATTPLTRYMTSPSESDLTTVTSGALSTLLATTNYNHTTSPGLEFTDVTLPTFTPGLLLTPSVTNGYTDTSFTSVTSPEVNTKTLESTLSPISSTHELITSITSSNTDFITTETSPFINKLSTVGFEESMSTLEEVSHETTSVATTAVISDVSNSTEPNPTTESSQITTASEVSTSIPILSNNISAKYLLPYEIQDYIKNNYPPDKGYPKEENTNDKYIYHPIYQTNDNEEPAEIIEGMPTKNIEDMPTKIIEDMPTENFEDMPTKIIEDMPTKIIEDMPTKIVEDMPTKIIEDMPTKIIEDMPTKIVEDMPTKVIEDTPTKIVEDMPTKIIETSNDTVYTKKSVTVGYTSNYYPGYTGSYYQIKPYYRYPKYHRNGLYSRIYLTRPFFGGPRFVYGYRSLN